MRPGKCKPGDDVDVGIYLQALALLRDRRGVALDGGANRGSWTRRMVRDFDAVYAFEPQLDVWRDLICSTSYWDGRRDQSLTIRNAALGMRSGTCAVAFDPKRSTSTAAFVLYRDHGPAGAGDAAVVEVVAIDELKLQKLDLLKLDLEGAEYFALAGGLETIRNFRPIIVFEESQLSEKHYGVGRYSARELLLATGYAVVAVEGVNVLAAPIEGAP